VSRSGKKEGVVLTKKDPALILGVPYQYLRKGQEVKEKLGVLRPGRLHQGEEKLTWVGHSSSS